MSIKFPCPNCKKGLTAKDEQAGKKVACPACKKPLVIPAAAPAPAASGPAAPAAALPPEDVEATVAALLSDQVARPGEQTTIDFTCEYCDAAISVPVADAGKRVPCPECKRILKVPAAAKADPTNWRRADMHLPSAAKAPDQPVPDGAWGSLTRTVVSRESLEEADAIPEKPEPVPLRERITFWGTVAVVVLAVAGVGLYSYRRHTATQERLDASSAVEYAAREDTQKQIGPERVAALHTLAGSYYLGLRLAYSDAPLANERGSADQGREEFELALKALAGADPRSADRDLGLGDLAVAMVDLGGDKDQQRDKMRTGWEDCLKRVRATLGAMQSPEAKLDAYRQVAARLVERGQPDAVRSLASTAFNNAPGQHVAARAQALLARLEEPSADRAAVERGCDELLKEYTARNRPPLAPDMVALAVVLGKKPPAPGKTSDDEDNARIGEAEGLARKGQLPDGRQKAMAAESRRVKLRALVAVGGSTKQGAEDLAAACKIALDGASDLGRESWVLLRLVRLGVRAGVPDDLLRKVAEVIADPAVRARARLELFRARLDQTKESAGIDLADAVDPKTPAGALARADLARHNVRFDRNYLQVARAWPEPLGAFGTLGALIGLTRDAN